MDNITLKKKLSAYVSSSGRLQNLNEDILYEVLIAWENWTGPSAEFYRTLGFEYVRWCERTRPRGRSYSILIRRPAERRQATGRGRPAAS
jgi:hypothetical protein